MTAPEQGIDAAMAHFDGDPDIVAVIFALELYTVYIDLIDTGEITFAGFAADGTCLWDKVRC